jgi:hypothetical protein
MNEQNQRDDSFQGVVPRAPGYVPGSVGPDVVAPMPMPPKAPDVIPKGIGPDVATGPLPPAPPRPKED